MSTEPTQLEPAAVLRILIGRLSRRIRRTEAGAQLTPTQLSVLASVVRHGPLGLAELSQLEGINPTMLSRIAAKLNRAGLIARRSDPHDGRAALLFPTKTGRQMQLRIHAERNDVLGQRLQELAASERRRLIDAIPALEALAEALRAADP